MVLHEVPNPHWSHVKATAETLIHLSYTHTHTRIQTHKQLKFNYFLLLGYIFFYLLKTIFFLYLRIKIVSCAT